MSRIKRQECAIQNIQPGPQPIRHVHVIRQTVFAIVPPDISVPTSVCPRQCDCAPQRLTFFFRNRSQSASTTLASLFASRPKTAPIGPNRA